MKETFGKFIRSRKGKVILICAAVIVITAAALICAGAVKKTFRTAYAYQVSGTVTAEKKGSRCAAYPAMKLTGGMTVSTDADSFMRMIVDDSKYLKLEENSRISFTDLGTDKKRRTAIELESGSLLSEISGSLGADEEYLVSCPNSVMAVRGTMFRITAGRDENGDAVTELITYGGSVECRSSELPEDTFVDAGYKLRIAGGQYGAQPVGISEISTEDLTDMYRASAGGHEMFCSSEEIAAELDSRSVKVRTEEISGDMTVKYVSFPKDGRITVEASGNIYENGEKIYYEGYFVIGSEANKFSTDISLAPAGVDLKLDYEDITARIYADGGREMELAACARADIHPDSGSGEVFTGTLSVTENGETSEYESVGVKISLYDGNIKVDGTSQMKLTVVLTEKDR